MIFTAYWIACFLWAKLVPVKSGYVIDWHPGSGSVTQDFKFVDPDPKEIFADPEK